MSTTYSEQTGGLDGGKTKAGRVLISHLSGHRASAEELDHVISAYSILLNNRWIVSAGTAMMQIYSIVCANH